MQKLSFVLGTTSCHCTMPEPGVFLKLQFQSLAAEWVNRGTTAYKPAMASVPEQGFAVDSLFHSPKSPQVVIVVKRLSNGQGQEI